MQSKSHHLGTLCPLFCLIKPLHRFPREAPGRAERPLAVTMHCGTYKSTKKQRRMGGENKPELPGTGKELHHVGPLEVSSAPPGRRAGGWWACFSQLPQCCNCAIIGKPGDFFPPSILLPPLLLRFSSRHGIIYFSSSKDIPSP